MFRQIEQAHGVSPEELWQKVAALAANTLMALRPGLVEFYAHERPRPLHPSGPKGFQIIGLDVLIDDSMQPILLELNANPSLSAYQPKQRVEGALEPSGDAVHDQAFEYSGVPEVPTASASSGSSSGRTGTASTAPRRSGSVARQSRLRLGVRERKDSKESINQESKVITSELDLQIKRELVCQALLMVRPALPAKATRQRKLWLEKNIESRTNAEIIPLNDEGAWIGLAQPSRVETPRPDAPERCPALLPLDIEALVESELIEYVAAHLSLYRCWRRSCASSQGTLGQVQFVKLVERAGLVGTGAVFADRIAVQLWVQKAWREIDGAYGVNLPQFVSVAGRLGKMLLGDPIDEDGETASHIQGVLEFVRRGLCGESTS